MNVEKWSKLIAQIIHDEFERRGLNPPEPYNDQAVLDLITEVSSKAEAITVRIDELQLEKGDKGDKGEPGKSVTHQEIVDEVRASLAAMADELKGEPGKDGLSVDVEALEDDLAATLEAKLLEHLPETVKRLLPPADELKGEKGDRGEAAPLPSDAELVSLIEPLIPEVQPGEKGDKGDKGDRGDDGVSPQMGDVVQEVLKALTPIVEKIVTPLIPAPVPGDKGDKGDQGDKGDDAPPLTMKQVSEGLKEFMPQIMREVAKTAAEAAPRAHKGVYNPEAVYNIGDEVIVRGSTFRKTADTLEEPPGEGWQMVSQGKIGKKGLTGDKGDKGDAGADGVSVVSIDLNDGQLIVTLSNGEIEVVEVEDLRPKTAIVDIGSPPNSGQFEGQMHFDPKAKRLHIWTGSKWEKLT